MRDLNFSLKQLCLNNPDGSYSTQAARLRCLNLIANQLHDLKFFHMLSSSLKPKHVDALLNLWHQQSISVGTIKNRLAHLRWWAHKTKKDGLIPSLNSQLHIPARSYVPDTSKAFSLTEQHLNLISDPFVRCSLQLQQAFGLRREEAIKFIPSWADKGDSIYLKGSWCKGGQPRSIPITNHNQRVVLDMAHSIAGKSSLIPSHRSYLQHLKVYESQCSRAGILNPHGLRHLYAQKGYGHRFGQKS